MRRFNRRPMRRGQRLYEQKMSDEWVGRIVQSVSSGELFKVVFFNYNNVVKIQRFGNDKRTFTLTESEFFAYYEII